MAPLDVHTMLLRLHVLDHAQMQLTDSSATHYFVPVFDELTRPRSKRQGR
jgi:hypothetical protein